MLFQKSTRGNSMTKNELEPTASKHECCVEKAGTGSR